jgi:UDP-GlcNAc3NAcA epimerase
MHDVALFYGERARRQSSILDRLGLTTKSFVLATCHRAENTDDKARLTAIIEALCDLSARMPVILPLHPRTHRLLQTHGLADKIGNIVVLEPLPYLDMVALEQAAYVICTDSGGVQKEAYFFDVPCVTMRDETEWVELVQAGGNQLAGADRERIKSAVKRASTQPKSTIQAYGDGHTAEKILNILIDQMTDAALEPKIQK